MAHNWSGWPGAVCQKCGAEHALENALALGWIDVRQGDEDKWISEDHKALVDLCDNHCSKDMSPEDFHKVCEEAKALIAKIGAPTFVVSESTDKEGEDG